MVCVAAYFEPKNEHQFAVHRAMDRTLRAWDEDTAEALAKEAGLLAFHRARRIVRDTRKVAAAEWPALLKDAPDSVRVTVTQRLKELVPVKGAVTAPGVRATRT